MKKLISIEVHEGVIDAAERIYLSLGMDMETALTIFLRRTIVENRFPLDMIATLPQATQPEPSLGALPQWQEDPLLGETLDKKAYSKISEAMRESVWCYFNDHVSGNPFEPAVEGIVEETGMNPGSAKIYLIFLENLRQGEPNTRNMKFSDLEWFMDAFHEKDLEWYKNALRSLEASIGYFADKSKFGNFAEKVRNFVNEKAPEGIDKVEKWISPHTGTNVETVGGTS